MRELSIQAASDTIGSPERDYTDVEYQELKKEISRISKATSFNGLTLLDGKSGVLEFQIGQMNDPMLDRLSFDFSQANSTTVALGIDSSLILIRIFEISPSPPSAVCIIEILSPAFLFACRVDLIYALNFSLIANPAASSAALVIRSPVDNFLKLSFWFLLFSAKER